MRWLRIISVYISLVLMTACASAPVAVDIPDHNITITARNDTEWKHTVLIYDWSKSSACVAAGDVYPGEQIVFTKLSYDHVYDIKWNSSWPEYQMVHWYSFKVTAGKVHFLTLPNLTTVVFGDIDANFETTDNTIHIKKKSPKTFR